jgi:hypothetical protein
MTKSEDTTVDKTMAVSTILPFFPSFERQKKYSILLFYRFEGLCSALLHTNRSKGKKALKSVLFSLQ